MTTEESAGQNRCEENSGAPRLRAKDPFSPASGRYPHPGLKAGASWEKSGEGGHQGDRWRHGRHRDDDPGGRGPPPHMHAGTESALVLEGRVRYHVDGETFEGGPGSFFHLPEGVWERFEPLETTRMLAIFVPGGAIDEFFAEVGEPATAKELPTPTEPDIAKIVEAAARYGMQIRP
ncbi:cupin domain-containing protein [Streptomyces sp. NPDC048337]|uniref:cupin domain-containing protein n=1 Tax=Streptomyces sp. NPDC048337 TaxID=3365535 RepID=UPI003710B68D